MTDTPDIWRTGTRIPLHVYETTGDQRPVATFFRPEDAERAMKAVNGAFYDPTEREEARYVSEQLTDVHKVLGDGFPDVVDNINPVKMARDVVQHARTLRAEVERFSEDRGDVEVWLQRIAAAAGVHQDELTDEAVEAACNEFQQNRRRVRDLELERERIFVAVEANEVAAWRQTAATNKKLADEWMARALGDVAALALARRDLQALRDQVSAAPQLPADLPVVESVESLSVDSFRVKLEGGITIWVGGAAFDARTIVAAGLAVLAAEAEKPDPVEELARELYRVAQDASAGVDWEEAGWDAHADYLSLARTAIAWTEKRDS